MKPNETYCQTLRGITPCKNGAFMAVSDHDKIVAALRANQESDRSYAHLMQEQRSEIAAHCKKLEAEVAELRKDKLPPGQYDQLSKECAAIDAAKEKTI